MKQEIMKQGLNNKDWKTVRDCLTIMNNTQILFMAELLDKEIDKRVTKLEVTQ